jgi:hypothetical protein
MPFKVLGTSFKRSFENAETANQRRSVSRAPKPESSTSRRDEVSSSGDYTRLRLELSLSDGGPVTGTRSRTAGLSSAFRSFSGSVWRAAASGQTDAEASAAAVQTAYEEGGASAGAAKLEEVTRDLPPEDVTAILELAQPTIDLITEDLGDRGSEEDGDYDDDKPFDEVMTVLATATNRAAGAPNGQEAIDRVGQSIVNNIDPNDIGRFDEALGISVQNGAGGELALSVISQLEAAGRVDQADDILQNVEDGVNALDAQVEDISERTAERDQELAWLIQQWSAYLDDEALQGAIDGYMAEHPDYARDIEERDRLGGALVRTINSLGDLPDNVRNLDHGDDVEGAMRELIGEPRSIAIMSGSESAGLELDRLQAVAESQGREAPAIFDIVNSAVDGADNSLLIREAWLDWQLKRSVGSIATTGELYRAHEIRYPEVDERISAERLRLESITIALGFDTNDFSGIYDSFEALAGSRNRTDYLRNLGQLQTQIDAFETNRAAEGSTLPGSFRSAGMVLAIAGATSAGFDLADEQDLETVSVATLEMLGLTGEISETQFGQHLLRNHSGLGKVLSVGGRVAGWAMIAYDGFKAFQYLADGDYANAGFSAGAAAGGAFLLAGSTGVGLVLLGGAIGGKLVYDLWQRSQEANKYESDGAEAFLIGAGMNPELANELINNDSRGRSPAPVFEAVAQSLGVEPGEFFEYFMTLEPDEAKALMEAAHGVDPNDEGEFDMVGADDPVFRPSLGPFYPEPRPNSIPGLIAWMRANGYEDAPGL